MNTPSYSENSNLKLQIVETRFGQKEYRRLCKLIKGSYHIINKDCFFINNQWHRIDNGKITKDWETDEWILIPLNTNKYNHGIVKIENDGTIITGWFKHNLYKNVNVHNYGKAISSDILSNYFVEDIANNMWISRSCLSEKDISQITQIRKSSYNFSSCTYNIDDDVKNFNNIRALYNNFPTSISNFATKLSKYIGNTSFGIEVETSLGNIPSNICAQLGLIPCKDGSLGENYKSAEWVSVPMTGAKGLQNIVNIGNITSKRCNVDIHCSYHIHYGNIPITRNYIVSLYLLYYKIQNELLEMFPYYKTDWRGVKQKNYCEKLKKLGLVALKEITHEDYKNYINFAYKQIFVFLSEGVEPSEDCNIKIETHPIKDKWARKDSRYKLMNLQNMIFSPRRTAEVRLKCRSSL